MLTAKTRRITAKTDHIEKVASVNSSSYIKTITVPPAEEKTLRYTMVAKFNPTIPQTLDDIEISANTTENARVGKLSDTLQPDIKK
ncbi:MAG: hypothetical protein IKV64_01795 [Clostridia bacterium]|nr:hypothetical protein [Clostridia bacterium]